MCLNPVKIKNPREFFRNELDSRFMYVPCGHCEECRNAKVNDWYVRLNYEYNSFVSSGGAVYFLTCTYNDAMCPRVCTEDFTQLIDEFDISVPYFSGMCFNKHHVVQFFKDFRAILKKKYGIQGLKYFVVCEFGTDQNGTHRPHYHMLIFCPVYVHESDFRSLANYCWSERLRKEFVPAEIVEQSLLPSVQERLKHGYYCVLEKWIIAPPSSVNHKDPMFKFRYGFTSWSKYGALVHSPACLKYVLKYIFKDENFTKTDVCHGLDLILSHCPSLDILEERFPPVDDNGIEDLNYKDHLGSVHTNPEFKRFHSLIQKVRDCQPFHVQSQKLGESLFQEIVCDWDKGYETLKNNKISFKYDEFLYSVPRYIIRRLFYDVGKKQQNRHYAKYSNYVFLNEIGKRCLCDFLDHRLDQYCKQFTMYLSSTYISMMSSDSVCGWCDQFGISFNQSLSILRRLSIDEVRLLFYYQFVFKGLNILCNNEYIKNWSVSDLLSHGHDLFIAKVNTSDLREMSNDYFEMIPDKCYVNIGDPSYPSCLNTSDSYVPSSFDELEIFRNSAKYLEWLTAIRYGVKFYKCENKREKFDRTKLLRSLYNRYVYQI